MTFKVMPEVQLRVDSAYPGDQGGGKARLDPETMLLLKISPGDLVAIEGKRRTVAKVWRALVEDWNQRKVRVDNFTRLNAGVSIGDTVKVVKIADEIEAKRVVLAPPEDLPKKIPIANNPHVVNGLIDFPVVRNDTIPIMLGLPFIQPQIVGFKVVEIEPEEAVIITKNTSIEFSDKPAAGFEGVKRFSYEDIGGLKDRAPAAPRDDRAPAAPPGTVPETRNRASQRRPPLRAARYRQDPDRKGSSKRERGALHIESPAPKSSRNITARASSGSGRSSRRHARTPRPSSSSTSSIQSRPGARR